MADAQRLFHPDDDAVMQSSTVLTTSGALATMPVGFLQDQQKTKVLRWGRYVVDENNDYLDINCPAGAGVSAVQLTHGTYDTPAAYAAMVQARLEAVEPTPVWDASWGVAAAGKFRLRDAGGAPVGISFLWATGANKHRSAGIDLGFDVSADDTGATTYTADRTSYQSRKFIVVSKTDGSAIPATAAWILEHTATQVGSAGVASKVTIQGNTTNAWPLTGLPFEEDFGDLGTVNALDDNNVPCIQYFATGQSLEFFRLIIDDVQHDLAYTEIGRFGLTTYSTVSICVSDRMNAQRQDFSTGADTIDGGSRANFRRNRRVIGLGWNRANAVDHAVLLQFFQGIQTRREWLFDIRVGSPTDLYYGHFLEPPTQGFVPIDYWDWSLTFYEAL